MKIETAENIYGVIIRNINNRFVALRKCDLSIIDSDNRLYGLEGKLELWQRENNLMESLCNSFD